MNLSVFVKNKLQQMEKHRFLFEELVRRDFKQKYKRTILGMGWSILSPLLTLLVMKLVFTYYFGRTIPHYTTYLFCGNLLFSYFRESTNGGMSSLLSNAAIFTKVNVPKYLFLFSKNVSSFINFILIMLVFFIFVYLDDISFTPQFLMLLFPVGCLVVFNLGVGMILSAMYVFFRDVKYLYDVFARLLMYCSAIFYKVPAKYEMYYLLNPVYVYIKYFRTIILEGQIPGFEYHLLCMFYAVLMFGIGVWMYRHYNQRFLYYV